MNNTFLIEEHNGLKQELKVLRSANIDVLDGEEEEI